MEVELSIQKLKILVTNMCMYTIITEEIKRDWNVSEEFVYSFAL